MLKVRWFPENDAAKPKGTPGKSAAVGVGAPPGMVRERLGGWGGGPVVALLSPSEGGVCLCFLVCKADVLYNYLREEVLQVQQYNNGSCSGDNGTRGLLTLHPES